MYIYIICIIIYIYRFAYDIQKLSSTLPQLRQHNDPSVHAGVPQLQVEGVDAAAWRRNVFFFFLRGLKGNQFWLW